MQQHSALTRSLDSSIRIGCLIGCADIVSRNGSSFEAVVRKAGLSPESLSTPDRMIPLSLYTRVLDVAAAECPTGNFGICFGDVFDIRNLGAIGYQMLHAGSWGEALETFCSNFSVVQDHSHMQLKRSGGLACLSYELSALHSDLRAQDAEFSMALLCRALTRLSPAFVPSRIDFQHVFRASARGTCLEEVEIRSRQPMTALYFDAAWLERPAPQADRYMHRLILEDLERELLTRSNRTGLIGALHDAMQSRSDGRGLATCSAGEIAAELGLSERTMHRRLEAYDTSFRDLRAAVCMEIACEYLLGSSMSVSQIGYRLGYSESSAFSRAFKAETGLSPSNFRLRGRLIS
ncbi:AraC family transcriptional regulator [Thioclava kandeliae]|uniref:AraC family transcriptional regulator ligand-binding domain-containing protein n=1 Tax=Thioclava kandeliae TaxID=3070818 RepID=A0ABV1SEL9_9RHOB